MERSVLFLCRGKYNNIKKAKSSREWKKERYVFLIYGNEMKRRENTHAQMTKRFPRKKVNCKITSTKVREKSVM